MLPSALIFELLAFLFGLLLGSFLNVCIVRLPDHRSINTPRSHCMKCLATIRWYDNIPILSWINLRAKCRNCGEGISWRYPAVELAVGLWFVWPARIVFMTHLAYSQLGRPFAIDWIDAIGLLILGFLLIGLLVMDWQTHTLPDSFTLSGTLVGFMLICCQSVFLGPHDNEMILHGKNPITSAGSTVDTGNVILTGPEHVVLGRLLAIVGAAAILLVIRWLYKLLRKQDGLGLGDVKLLAMIAAFLGFWPAVLAMFVGVVTCAGYALTLVARRRANALTRLPLGSFLCLGGLFAAVFGTALIDWYTALL